MFSLGLGSRGRRSARLCKESFSLEMAVRMDEQSHSHHRPNKRKVVWNSLSCSPDPREQGRSFLVGILQPFSQVFRRPNGCAPCQVRAWFHWLDFIKQQGRFCGKDLLYVGLDETCVRKSDAGSGGSFLVEKKCSAAGR